MIHELIKMSMPGWEFTTSHEEVVLGMLENCICSTCTKTDEVLLEEYGAEEAEMVCMSGFSADYATMTFEDKMSELLGTPCGCEYSYNTFEDYLSYHKSEVDDWEAMK